jgi:hypothetical protein
MGRAMTHAVSPRSLRRSLEFNPRPFYVGFGAECVTVLGFGA